MVLMFDVNVIIDVFTRREPFFSDSHKTLSLCDQDKYIGVLWTGEITTVSYLLQKKIGKNLAREHVHTILELFEIVDVSKEDILEAELSDMEDFEDAVIAFCAKRAKADFIITRNIGDYEKSPVKAISPEDFLKQMSNTEEEEISKLCLSEPNNVKKEAMEKIKASRGIVKDTL